MWSGTRRAAFVQPRILLAVILAGASLAWHGTAQNWDSEAADAALKQARELRKKLPADKSARTEDYLRCIGLYKRVFLSDPHYSGSDDSIYEAATLYQEMAARFGAPEYNREAADLLRFLVKDYPSSPFKPYAILRLAAMGPARAGTPARTAAVPPQPRPLAATAQAQPKTAPAPARSPGAPETARVAMVQCITHESRPEFTRVLIDLDARVSYRAEEAANPDRVFFDLSNARLSPEASGTTIAVRDQLVRRVRTRQNQPRVVRVVLDLDRGADFTVTEMSAPFRIVIDVRKKPAPTATATISP